MGPPAQCIVDPRLSCRSVPWFSLHLAVLTAFFEGRWRYRLSERANWQGARQVTVRAQEYFRRGQLPGRGQAVRTPAPGVLEPERRCGIEILPEDGRCAEFRVARSLAGRGLHDRRRGAHHLL